MNQNFSAAEVLGKLTRFQRNSVAHVMDRLYSPDGVDRFLVADQTGLGKTMVARGVIARVIERLQHDPGVDRIDIVYICSNADLAQQNLRKLDVTSGPQHTVASRLTLLAKHSRRFPPVQVAGRPRSVNLVSFTPGTSFSTGFRSGKAEERAMLWLLMEQAAELGPPSAARDRAAHKVLQGNVATVENFERCVNNLRAELGGQVHEGTRTAFLDAIRKPTGDGPSLIERMARAMDENEEDWNVKWSLIAELRATLARESVRLLTPDLVILDEFQRFRELLNRDSEAGELAHHLFDFRQGEDGTGDRAKVLMLSATPFKPFTYQEESVIGDDHHRDFLEVVGFLADGDPTDPAGRIRQALADYREALISGGPAHDLAERVRREMLQVMVRTERPSGEEVELTTEVLGEIAAPSPDEITGFVALRELARFVGAPMSIGYWKAVPYFVNFMSGYKVGEKVKQALGDPTTAAETRRILDRTQRLDVKAMSRLQPVPMGDARLQHVHDLTIGEGWAKLLWLPPSLPYLRPGGPFKKVRDATKLLIFSFWGATPTAIASLLSYEANRVMLGKPYARLTPEKRERDRLTRAGRLQFRLNRSEGRPDSMSTLGVFWPMPGLAAIGDPRAAARRAGGEVSADDLRAEVAAALRAVHVNNRSGDAPASFWFEAFRREDSFPAGVDEAAARSYFAHTDEEAKDSRDGAAGVQRHVSMAFEVRGSAQDRPVTAAVLATLAQVAAHSPGNIAYRAVGRLRSEDNAITDEGHWRAAVRLSLGLRSLFTRPETSRLLDQLRMPRAPHYWRRILQYCEWGNLQSVLDEYLHHLAVAEGGAGTDEKLLAIVDAAVEAITLRPSTYQIFDPDHPDQPVRMNARFALRFGSRDDAAASDGVRMPQVRQAFNSPFWPFVLASTSIGQEGVDLHWWSHALLHWNTPNNPVDFEQREGRVDRYEGHAVRKNVAEHHGAEMLTSPSDNPWEAGYRIAATARPELGAFAPHWVYPGPAKIERHVAPLPLSIDQEHLESVKKKVALYRLTFGQPRQEDMLELVEKKLVGVTPEELARLRLDLSAPPTD
ncbi:hypothetical protein [Enemella sp. A6]|uniref:hypothetical protein n=1 Tax=Enemella sp. A6 TaxID=3440152 RepID=UPI003EBE1AC9